MYFIDTSFHSLIKYGEELCGDHIEQVNMEDSKIIVLSDGLGSGVKANILATMTSKIASTMLRGGSTLDETIDTIVHTLPICHERKLAYSTFTILKINRDGSVYAAEFDNPSLFLHKKGKEIPIEKAVRIINGKKIFESKFVLDKETLLVAVSDGVVHAGVGTTLDLGWEWHNVNEFIREISKEECSAQFVTRSILEKCRVLYNDRPGDDTTVVSIKIREQESVNLFTGPPKDPDNDKITVERIIKEPGKVIVCGGTTANIVSRILGCELEIDISTMTPNIPPAGKMPGVELVTEGVLTINRTIQILKAYLNPSLNARISAMLMEKNAGAMLARILIEDCDKLNIWIGQAVNPVHQENDFIMNFNFKMQQIQELADYLRKLGKEVTLHYI